MPLLDVPGAYRIWVAAAFLLETIARDTIGDPDTAGPARWHHGPDETLISETADLLASVDRLASPPGTLTRPPRPLLMANPACCIICRPTSPPGRSATSCTYR